MDQYKLIDLDQMEASLVRRRLRRWSKNDEEAIRPLVVALKDKGYLTRARISQPRYETNVYPLYYYWAHQCGMEHRAVYRCTLDWFLTSQGSLPADTLRPHVERIVNSEIDILVEDLDYFAFIEAKEVKDGERVKYETTEGVHQLVRQYVQGRILEVLTHKTFVLATIGANSGQVTTLDLNPVEVALLQLIGEQRVSFDVVDLSWPTMAADGRALGGLNS